MRRRPGSATTSSWRLAAAGTSAAALGAECTVAAVDQLLDGLDELPWDAEAYGSLERVVRARAGAIASDALEAAATVLVIARRVRAQLARLMAPALRTSTADAAAQLERLVSPGWVVRAGAARLTDVARYVRGIEYRLDRLADDVPRDVRRMTEVRPLEAHFAEIAARHRRLPPQLEAVRWQLEELRLSVFAQSIGVIGPVSRRRITAALDAL